MLDSDGYFIRFRGQNIYNKFVVQFILHYDNKTVLFGPDGREVFIMKLLKRIALSGLAVTFLTGIMVFGASAQTRVRLVRSTTSQPVIVRRYYYNRYYNPFWRGTLWDPFYYDPYYYDPYLRAQRDKYYKEKEVRDARRNLAKNQEKYGSDGYLTPKEQEKLAKAQRRYAKAVASLNKFNRNY
jgi:hypothetical protein